jgi:hypothetical protein
MSIRQALVDDYVETAKIKLGIKKNDLAFLRQTHSLITGTSLFDFEKQDIVDGGHDKQIDLISIEESDGCATIYIIQAKYTQSFQSDIIIKLNNGLNWLFATKREDYGKLKNKRFVDRINDVRDVQRRLGPSNLDIKVYYVTNAENTNGVSDECNDEINQMTNIYNNETYNSFSFDLISADELVDVQQETDVKNKNIDVDIPLIYDVNNPSIINYQKSGVQSLICTVSATELSKVIAKDKKRHIFALNVRKFLGVKGAVNSNIYRTCTNKNQNKLFWFLNNGLTMTCDSFDMVHDPDEPHVKLKNVQIVNGCQTASTLTHAYEQGTLLDGTTVMVRIYKTDIENLVEDIVVTTNTQNKITPRDLRSNYPEQIDIQTSFMANDYFYERKPREFDSNNESTNINTMTNDFVGRSVLAAVLGKCGDARSRKGKIWSEHYDKIFTNIKHPEILLIPSILYLQVKDNLNEDLFNSDDISYRYLVKNASLHVLKIVCFLWRGSSDWNDGRELNKQLQNLKSKRVNTLILTKKAVGILQSMFDEHSDLNAELKSSQFDHVLTKELFVNHF